MHNCQIDGATNCQILEKIVKIVMGHKNLTNKLRVKKENCSETFNQIKYTNKVGAVTTAEF